jgi:predicted XRE-type DNA-binding protein
MALAKANLAHQIAEVIRKRDLSQLEAAEVLGVNQPKVSSLLRGRLDGFSVERLLKFLNLLNVDVEIVVREQKGSKRRGSTRVLTA